MAAMMGGGDNGQSPPMHGAGHRPGGDIIRLLAADKGAAVHISFITRSRDIAPVALGAAVVVEAE